jgi:hypothetical protein
MNEQDSSKDGKEEQKPIALHSGTDGHDVQEEQGMVVTTIARRWIVDREG